MAKPKDELVTELASLVEDAVSQKSSIESDWDAAWDYYNGQQWKHLKGKMPPWTYAHTTTLNLVKPVIQTILPIIGDAASIWYVAAYSPEDDPKAEALTRYLQAYYHEQKVARAYALAAKDALCMGTGALKVFLNEVNTRYPVPSLRGTPTARVDVAYLDPYTIFPDPNAQNLEDCRFVALRNVVGRSLLQRLYKGQSLNFEGMEAENVTDRRGQWYGTTRLSSGEERYKVWEVYHEFGERLTVFSGNEVLWDGESPVPNHRIPVVLFIEDERGTDLWGSGITANGASQIQKAVNEIVWYIKLHAVTCLNPRFVKKGIGSVEMTNEPGGIISLHNPQGEMRPLDTPPLPPYVFSLIQLLLRLWDVSTGVHDVTQGVRPVGVQSGRAIMQLQEAAQTRLRELIRAWGAQLAEVGQLVLDMMQRYYRTPQSVFHVRDSGPERVTVEPGMLRGIDERPIPFRVVVQPQQDLPLGQSARAELLMQLAAIPWPDPMLQKLVFNALRIPERFEYFAEKDRMRQMEVKEAYQRELEHALMGRGEAELAASPAPAAPETADTDFVAALGALGGGGGALPQ